MHLNILKSQLLNTLLLEVNQNYLIIFWSVGRVLKVFMKHSNDIHKRRILSLEKFYLNMKDGAELELVLRVNKINKLTIKLYLSVS
jgi:hypothetical protein